MKTQAIQVSAKQYENSDDSLAAAEQDYLDEHGLDGWSLNPRWLDDERDVIVLDVPNFLAEKLVNTRSED